MIVGGVILFVLGALMKFALEMDLVIMESSTAGVILMIAGVVLFLVGLFTEISKRNRKVESRTSVDERTGEAVREDRTTGGI